MNELKPAGREGPERQAPLSIDEQLKSLQRDMAAGLAPLWSHRLKSIQDEARLTGFSWEPRHQAQFREILQQGIQDDVESVRSAPDVRAAGDRLAILENDAKTHGLLALFSDKIAELKTRNQFAQSAEDLKDGELADSGDHFLRGAALTLGNFK